jgi:hypothetical protein
MPRRPHRNVVDITVVTIFHLWRRNAAARRKRSFGVSVTSPGEAGLAALVEVPGRATRRRSSRSKQQQ